MGRRLEVGEWSTEAVRTLDMLSRLKSERLVEFWTGPMVQTVREVATATASGEGRAVYQEHVLLAAGQLSASVGAERWRARHPRSVA